MRVRVPCYHRLGMKHKQSAPSSANSPNATYKAEPPPRLAAEQKEKGHAVLEHVPKRLKDDGLIAEYVSCKDREQHRLMPIQRGGTSSWVIFPY